MLGVPALDSPLLDSGGLGGRMDGAVELVETDSGATGTRPENSRRRGSSMPKAPDRFQPDAGRVSFFMGHFRSRLPLLTEEPDGDADRICSALSGNLCHCTGYAPIIEAVLEARAAYRNVDKP